MLSLTTNETHAAGAARDPDAASRIFSRPFKRREAKYVFAGRVTDAPGPKHADASSISYRWFVECVTVEQLRNTPPFDAYSYRPGRRDGVRRLNEERSVAFYRVTYRGRPCVCALVDGCVYLFCQAV